MADFEERLSTCYSLGARGGPMFSTEVTKTTGGQAYTNRNWTMPLHRYDITQAVREEADFAELREFFFNVGGRADAFRFKDLADYRATAQPLAAVTVGTLYQLTKVYTRGARSFSRTINKPVNSIAVFRNGSSISPTIDYTTGRVTISGHTGGDVYTWTGEFDVRVAFTSDAMEHEIVNKGSGGLLIQWPSIQVEERRA